MDTLRPIATDTADFPQLRREGRIYVDKTGYMFNLVANRDTKLFFLSHPRRFGKSLMISTLKAIFEGRRELFDGLAISKTNWEWEKFPLIHFSFADVEIRRDLSPLTTALTAGKDTRWAVLIGNNMLGGDWNGFFAGLKTLYASLAYGPNERPVHEYSLQRILCTLLAAQGIVCKPECVQSGGRADVIAEHPIGIYIFELKVGESTNAAFEQIEAKDYAEPYKADGRPIWLIALSFDRQTRRLVDCAVRQATEKFITKG